MLNPASPRFNKERHDREFGNQVSFDGRNNGKYNTINQKNCYPPRKNNNNHHDNRNNNKNNNNNDTFCNQFQQQNRHNCDNNQNN